MFWPFNKSRQIQAKWQLRRVFWRQLEETGQLRTVFWTSFSLLTKDANFKQIDRCAQSFDANCGQQDSCARSFGQVVIKTRQVQAERKLCRVFWRQFQSTGQLRTVFLSNFSFLKKDANFKQNESCSECFDTNFNQLDICARCFGQALAFKQKSPISTKTLAAQSVLTEISSNRTVAHSVLHKV